MKKCTRNSILILAGSLVLGVFQQGHAQMSVEALQHSEAAPAVTAPMQEIPTVAGVASANEAFSTLVTALQAAGLVSTLDGNGPFTVFAPTNDAFAKLPEGAVANLLQPENKATLTGILTYHVVAGKFMAADVVQAIKDNNNAFPVKTVNGGILTLSLDGSSVVITDVKGNKSTVTATDVRASNGVIHVIDTVVMPE